MRSIWLRYDASASPWTVITAAPRHLASLPSRRICTDAGAWACPQATRYLIRTVTGWSECAKCGDESVVVRFHPPC